MKLPNKDDPEGDLEGALPLSIVVNALFKSRVDVKHLDDNQVTLTKGNVLRVYVLANNTVYGLMIRDMIRTFDLNIEDLYGKNILH